MIACNYVNSVSFHYCTWNFSFNSFHAMPQSDMQPQQQHRIPHIVTSVLPIKKSYRFQARLKPFILWDFYWTRAQPMKKKKKQTTKRTNITKEWSEKKKVENIFPWNLIQRFVSKKIFCEVFFLLSFLSFRFSAPLVASSFLHLIKIFLNKKCFHFKFFDFFHAISRSLALALTHTFLKKIEKDFQINEMGPIND